MEGLNIICFLWGDWPEPGWGKEYVRRLYRGVADNLDYPYHFICYSDTGEDVGPGIIVRKNLCADWPGCLPKLFAYSPDAGLRGRTIILDLDNVITGSLNEMAQYSGPLAVRAWFRGYDQGMRVPDGDMIGFDAGSPYAQYIWEEASKDPKNMIAKTGGRERYFLRELPHIDLWQDILGPKAILSYKNHLRRGQELTEETCIVSCHDGGLGPQTCRPHQLDAPFIHKYWV